MSASNSTPTFGGPIAKSRSEIKRSKDKLFKQSFNGLEDGEVYRDPLGVHTPGALGTNPIKKQEARREQLRNEPVPELADMVPAGETPTLVKAWNHTHRDKGFGIEETARTIQKNLDTGDWTLPVDILSDVFVVNPERLPMADMLTRATTQDDVVTPTPLTDHPSYSFGLETTNDTEGSYTYSDPDYDGDLSFDVVGMGAATRLEDKLILASSNVRSAESTQQEAFMRGAQQELERQIILGTNNNASGFDGFDDLISSGQGGTPSDASISDTTSANPEDYEAATRNLIDEAEFQGASSDSLAVVCDYDWHTGVRESLVSQQRYEGNITELNAGFEALTLDNVPVMRSNAITRIGQRTTGTYTQAYTVNMEATYLSVLQELQMKPLAKVAPQEQMAFDFYGTLTSEDNGAHIQGAEVTVP
jgi:hypothetical protein